MTLWFRRADPAKWVFILAACLIPGLPAAAGPEPAAGVEPIDPAWGLCRQEIAEVERAERIPAHLLAAIAVVESGRQAPRNGAGRREISAWPWTVMAEGKGRYLPSKAEAIAEVERLRSRGVRNIDVGCMQVNLMYHPDAFADLEEAFDPAANVAYAASFLKALREDKGSWAKAVAHYHSATPERHTRYRAKVFAAWRDERRRALRDDSTAELTVAAAAVTPEPEIQVATPAIPPVPADESALLETVAFGRAGPVAADPEPALQIGLAAGIQVVVASDLQPGG